VTNHVVGSAGCLQCCGKEFRMRHGNDPDDEAA
jgi:hypothetical protein